MREGDLLGYSGVALPTEGVDRNYRSALETGVLDVALPTEGVDRNLYEIKYAGDDARRPPHGGRG